MVEICRDIWQGYDEGPFVIVNKIFTRDAKAISALIAKTQKPLRQNGPSLTPDADEKALIEIRESCNKIIAEILAHLDTLNIKRGSGEGERCFVVKASEQLVACTEERHSVYDQCIRHAVSEGAAGEDPSKIG